MNTELSTFAARLRESISFDAVAINELQFSELALELFALQFQFNSAYQKICAARGLTPATVKEWRHIPAVPTSAFKELELSSIPSTERQQVFHSSGTTEQRPSRHFHHAQSLAVYKTSLWTGFSRHFAPDGEWLFLTPPPSCVPHSSLVHMFETVRQKLDLPASSFAGGISADGAWILDFPAVVSKLQSVVASNQRITLLGTAFSFVHLLDHLAEADLHFHLPAGSRVMETGGYKNRSRTMPKTELHTLISVYLGVPPSAVVCEYGMSELSSQAYAISKGTPAIHQFRFPPWARVQIVSPETGKEVTDGQPGMIRIFDLANVFSVAAIQTEDLGVRRGDGFELIGRALQAEARGCSLMTAA